MDINGDGHMDIFSGCYSQSGHNAMVGSFWVFYGDEEGKFAKPVELKGTDGELLQIHPDLDGTGDGRLTENICTRPFAVDWDGDGDLDILAGNFKGTFFLFTGEGEGKFKQDPVELTDTEGNAIKISGVHSDPFVVDWDGDGDLDLISGSSDGNIFWAENVTPTQETTETSATQDRTPKLAPFKKLIETPEQGPTYGLRVHVADFDGDGKLDILAGDRHSSGGGMKEDLTEEEQAEFKAAEGEYQEALKDYRAVFDKYRKDYDKAIEEAGELSQKEQRELYKELVSDKAMKDPAMKTAREAMSTARSKMQKYQVPTVRTGHVWLYTQK